MTISTSLVAFVKAAIWGEMSNVYTTIPCVVINVRANGSEAMVDIQPTINQKFIDGKEKRRTPILGVPVSFPISSTAGVMFPIKKGTTGVAMFSMRSIELWKGSRGGFVSPANAAKFDRGDAIFVPGIQPPSIHSQKPSRHTWNHSPDDLVLYNNIGTGQENEVRLKPSGDILVNTNQNTTIVANNATVNATNVTVNATSNINMTCDNFSLAAATASFNVGSTNWAGTFGGTGTYTFNGIEFNGHKHTGVQTGSGVSGATTN